MLWACKGGIFATLSFVTVFSYLIVALAKYKMSKSENTIVGVTLTVYSVVQIGFLFLFRYTIKDTIMYMVAGELKTICEKYGELCSEYGILEKKEDLNDSDELPENSASLVTWAW